MNPNDQAIQVRLYFPGKDPTFTSLRFDGREARAAFAPLPREREIFRPADALAAETNRMRSFIADQVAASARKMVLEAFAHNDPISGYSPVEWRKMHADGLPKQDG